MASIDSPNHCIVHPLGNDLNGGGFCTQPIGTPGIDWSQQNGPMHAGTDLVHDTADSEYVIPLSQAGAPDPNAVGNWINVYSGSGWVLGRGQIRAIVARATITGGQAYRISWDAAPTFPGTQATYRIGGALATPGELNNLFLSYTRIFIQAGTYLLTTSTPGPAGPVQLDNMVGGHVEPYVATPGDYTPFVDWVTIDAGAQTGIDLWKHLNTSGIRQTLTLGVVADGKNGAGNNGFRSTGADNTVMVCQALGCPGDGYYREKTFFCLADGCGVGFYGNTYRSYCEAMNSLTHGFYTGIALAHCISHHNGTNGYEEVGQGYPVLRCIAAHNGQDGFDEGGTANLIECISAENGRYGYATGMASILTRCADFNNALGRWNRTPYPAGAGTRDLWPMNLAANPWLASASGDFRLDPTGPDYALLRAMGWGNQLQTEAPDINALMEVCSPAGGGGGVGPAIQRVSGPASRQW